MARQQFQPEQSVTDITYIGDRVVAEAINVLANFIQNGGATNYSFSAPTSGSTVESVGSDLRSVLNPIVTLAALTIVLPPYPADGQVYETCSTKRITTLNVTSSDGSTVRGGSFTLNADSGASWIYRLATNTWYVRY